MYTNLGDDSSGGLLDTLASWSKTAKTTADTVKNTGILSNIRAMRRSNTATAPAVVPPTTSSNMLMYAGLAVVAILSGILIVKVVRRRKKK